MWCPWIERNSDFFFFLCFTLLVVGPSQSNDCGSMDDSVEQWPRQRAVPKCSMQVVEQLVCWHWRKHHHNIIIERKSGEEKMFSKEDV